MTVTVAREGSSESLSSSGGVTGMRGGGGGRAAGEVQACEAWDSAWVWSACCLSGRRADVQF